MVAHAQRRVRKPLKDGERARGIGIHPLAQSARQHVGGAVEQRLHVDADERRRKESHRREHRKPPAHIGGNGERDDAILARNAAKRSLLRICDEDEVSLKPRPELALEAIAHDQVLRHRLGGAAGLGDDDEERAPELEAIERRGERRGIDVLEHVQPRIVLARLIVELVPDGRSERRSERDGAERRPADPEHHDVGERLPDTVGKALELVESAAAGHQVHEAEDALVAEHACLLERAREVFRGA